MKWKWKGVWFLAYRLRKSLTWIRMHNFVCVNTKASVNLWSGNEKVWSVSIFTNKENTNSFCSLPCNLKLWIILCFCYKSFSSFRKWAWNPAWKNFLCWCILSVSFKWSRWKSELRRHFQCRIRIQRAKLCRMVISNPDSVQIHFSMSVILHRSRFVHAESAWRPSVCWRTTGQHSVI